MRRVKTLVGVAAAIVAVAGVGLCAFCSPEDGLERARTLLKRAREAIGGEEAIRRVRLLVIKGTMTAGFDAVTGQPLSRPHTVELRIAPPDRYLQIEREPLLTRQSGFSGDVLLNSVTSTGDMRSGGHFPVDRVMKIERMRFAQLALGILADLATVFPLTPMPSNNAVRASSVRVSGPDAFFGILDLDEGSGAPASLRFRSDLVFPRPITREERLAGIVPPLPAAEPTDIVMSFEDRRDVGGLRLPFRIRRTARGMTFEDIRVERVSVNPPLGFLEKR